MLQTNLLNPGHADLVTRKLLGAIYLMELISRCCVRVLRREVYVPTLLNLDLLIIVATCSADQRIKIFHKSAEDTWEPEAEWKVSF